MKILVIDHAGHSVTRSSDFFVVLLRAVATVDVVYVDPDLPEGIAHLPDTVHADLVVLWQMDFLAPIFIALGHRTVCIPMFDGSSTLPDLHWIWSRHARFINFSRWMHEHIERLGQTSFLIKYFKAPEERVAFDADSTFKVFLWQRRPEHGINLGMIESLFGHRLKAVHIHNSLDDKSIDAERYLKRPHRTYDLTVSTWFSTHDDYLAVLETFNTFIAPRRSEGIGMALLEAMSRGMLCIAADDATHNEYICNEVNGVLFNPDQPHRIDVGHAQAIGRSAFATVEDGYLDWVGAIPKMMDFIRSTPAPPEASDIDVLSLSRGLIGAFRSGTRTYARYLLGNTRLIESMSGVRLKGALSPEGRYRPDLLVTRPGSLSAAFPWLESLRLDASVLANRRYVIEGHVVADDSTAWIVDDGVRFGFHMDSRFLSISTLVIRLRVQLDPTYSVKIVVILNGYTVGELAVTDRRQDFNLPIDGSILHLDNVLQFQMVESGARPRRGSPSAFGLDLVEFA